MLRELLSRLLHMGADYLGRPSGHSRKPYGHHPYGQQPYPPRHYGDMRREWDDDDYRPYGYKKPKFKRMKHGGYHYEGYKKKGGVGKRLGKLLKLLD